MAQAAGRCAPEGARADRHPPQRPPRLGFGRDLGVAQHHPADPDDVAVVQLCDSHLAAIDERSGGAAVVKHADRIGTVAADGDDRVAARDVRVLESNVGDQAAPDVGDRPLERDQPAAAVVLDRQVAPRRRDLSEYRAGASGWSSNW